MFRSLKSPCFLQALEKADAIVASIGYPDFIMNATELGAYYAAFNVSAIHYSNVLNYNVFSFTSNLQQLLVPVDRTESVMWSQFVYILHQLSQMADDPRHCQCLLRSVDERHSLPSRHPAAAVLWKVWTV